MNVLRFPWPLRPFSGLLCRHCAFAALSMLLVVTSTMAQLRTSPSLNLGRAAQDNTQRSADFIVAVVNSEPVTNNEVRNRLLQIEQQISANGGAMPPRQELYAQVLERLISERAQLQQARDSGIRVDNAAVDAAVMSIARQNQLSISQLQQRMREDGVDYNSFRNSLRDDILLQRVREREVEPRVKVTDTELDQFIREQRETQDDKSVEINIAQILVAVPEGATEAQILPLAAKAQRAFERARASEDFAVLARELSDSADRASGGQLGMRTPDRYPSLFADTVANLKPGAVAAPVRSGAGFHVLKLLDRRQLGLANLTVSQTRARHILLRTGAQLSESVARERLAALRQRIGTGLDFATAARDNSQDGSASQGGDLGWASPGQFVPEFEEVMNALALGQVSDPVVSRFGVHLIQVQERRERSLNEREQREAARAALREKKLDEAFFNWAQDLRSKAYVELRVQPQ